MAPGRRCALLFSLINCAASLNLPLGLKPAGFDIPTPALPDTHPTITNAPLAETVEFRLLQARTLPSLLPCATSCFNSVATKSTNCKANDYECQCESVNANIIELGALTCVQSGCGVYAAEGVWSVAADFCSSVNAGDYDTDSTSDATSTEEDGASPTTVVVVTKTGDSGSAITSTVSVAHQTGSSGSSSGSSPGSSKSSGLSKGAIAGIAVGAAGGAILICAVLFLIYRCVRKRPTYAAVAPADISATAQAPPPVGAQAIVPGKPELDSKMGIASSTAAVSPATPDLSGVSRYPSMISNPSPQPAPAVPAVPIGPPPTYPPVMSELQAGQWQYGAQQPWQSAQNPPPGYGAPVPPPQQSPVHYEMPGARPPELVGNTQMTQELHGYPYHGGVHEMPGNRMT